MNKRNLILALRITLLFSCLYTGIVALIITPVSQIYGAIGFMLSILTGLFALIMRV